jgi:hypothetical protein
MPCVVDRDVESAPDDLLAVLDSLSDLLARYDEHQWARWIKTDRQCIAGDVSGIDHLLRAYGGMGSLNDLVIMPINGHKVDPGDVDAVNARLSHLRSQAYAAAMSAKLSHRRYRRET